MMHFVTSQATLHFWFFSVFNKSAFSRINLSFVGFTCYVVLFHPFIFVLSFYFIQTLSIYIFRSYAYLMNGSKNVAVSTSIFHGMQNKTLTFYVDWKYRYLNSIYTKSCLLNWVGHRIITSLLHLLRSTLGHSSSYKWNELGGLRKIYYKQHCSSENCTKLWTSVTLLKEQNLEHINTGLTETIMAKKEALT